MNEVLGDLFICVGVTISCLLWCEFYQKVLVRYDKHMDYLMPTGIIVSAIGGAICVIILSLFFKV